MARKSKPVFTLNVDSAKDHFTLDYLADGLSAHVEGSIKRMSPRIRALMLPAMTIMGGQLGGIAQGCDQQAPLQGDISVRQATKAEAKVLRKSVAEAKAGKLVSKGSFARFARKTKKTAEPAIAKPMTAAAWLRAHPMRGNSRKKASK